MSVFSEEPVVDVQNAYILQEYQTVLGKVTFQITKGEFVYLIGRTGSGKSSLLKTLYADLPLRSGEMKVAGYSIQKIKRADIPFLRRKIGIIFQDFQLFPDRSVADNLLFVMRATGWTDSARIKSRLAEVLMRVGLGAIGTKMPHQLSGGEQQRVVIARALLNEPQILFADEPTGNLDPEVSEGILQLFMEINRSGTAVLMATHNHNFLKQHPARILKCQSGKLIDSLTDEISLTS
ncbi:ATP-binding cassette domain-containing protein [Rhodocytophaga aerolata]|uniref:ATP-binding cassette domain-containing protein n=1 Tax=Rhodocytophaga aerolata TaxID=455078 RepID=A0ABT8R700_9BACT|nr:ATP-binding cassette domain-containing protein [Rhodocytophaga aerolata]MDO1447886.1 ATP-binding cassette domain-containing protein [Rhodocytophaga aerolata]